jgi:hypothetical protein
MSKELQEAYKEYIALLEKSEGSSIVFMAVHGMGAAEEDIKRGKELREKIAKLEALA